MTKAGGGGQAEGVMVSVVNHDVPTDPVKLHVKRLAQADAAIESARLKVEKLKQHLATAGKEQKDRQRSHLAGAQKALAQATAARKELG